MLQHFCVFDLFVYLFFKHLFTMSLHCFSNIVAPLNQDRVLPKALKKRGGPYKVLLNI